MYIYIYIYLSLSHSFFSFMYIPNVYLHIDIQAFDEAKEFAFGMRRISKLI